MRSIINRQGMVPVSLYVVAQGASFSRMAHALLCCMCVFIVVPALSGCGKRNYLGSAEGKEGFTNSLGLRMVLVSPGEFMMGGVTTDSEGNELPGEDQFPVHPVRINKGFYLGATEVTQKQWRLVMGTTPWRQDGEDRQFAKSQDDHAVNFVSWYDAVEFCERLSAIESRKYRLPTEAEWEYACRAGTQTDYCFGNSPDSLPDYAWFELNAGNTWKNYPHSVGQKKPNSWGFVDMHGNVVEWCQDGLHYIRNVRGGGFTSDAWWCRCGVRSCLTDPNETADGIVGFRVLCELE